MAVPAPGSRFGAGNFAVCAESKLVIDFGGWTPPQRASSRFKSLIQQQVASYTGLKMGEVVIMTGRRSCGPVVGNLPARIYGAKLAGLSDEVRNGIGAEIQKAVKSIFSDLIIVAEVVQH